MRRIRIFQGFLPGLLLALASLPAIAGEDLVVHNPWVREPPPMASMLAGYVTLENKTSRAIKITGASSPAFASVEMHRSVIKNGMAKMIKHDQVTVPAHGTFKFAPGGYHLMLIQPKHAFEAGDTVQMTLRSERGLKLSFEMPVRKAGAGNRNVDMPMKMNH